MTRVLLVLVTITAVATSVAGAQTFPNRIELPDGFQPEGIAIAGDQFYVGSIPTGKVYEEACEQARAQSSSPRRQVRRRSA